MMMRAIVLFILMCQVPQQAFGMARGKHTYLDSSAFALRNGTSTFEEFVQKYHRTYQAGTKEYEQRRALFEVRLAEIVQHNSKRSRAWTATINKLTDRTTEELKTLRGWNGAARPKGASSELVSGETRSKETTLSGSDGKETGPFYAALRGHLSREPDAAEAELPKCVSWTHLESMSHENILDQSSCGSCWAFAAAKTLQAHSEIHQHYRTFSAEQILSCTKNPQHCGGDGGCKGATAELAFEYVLGAGVETEEAVPYEGVEKICNSGKYHDNGPYSSSLLYDDGSEMHSMDGVTSAMGDVTSAMAGGADFGMTGWMKLKENSLISVKQALVDHGPLAVGVSAGYGWNYYSSGILTQESCPADATIDHAVTLVGYGSDHSHKYWHILNSWGAEWGEGGFIRITMSKSEGDYCGMDYQPQMGTACEGETDPVKVCGTCGILYDTSLPIFAGSGAAAKQSALEMCS